MTRDERRTFWLCDFEAWSSGDESQAAYCRRHGLSPMTFSQWKRRFERERLDSAGGSAESAGAPRVEVRVADDGPPVEASGLTVAIDARIWNCRVILTRPHGSARWRRLPMLGADPAAKVYLAAGVTDMRTSVDGLAVLVADVLGAPAADTDRRCLVLARRELEWVLEGLPVEQPGAHQHLGVSVHSGALFPASSA